MKPKDQFGCHGNILLVLQYLVITCVFAALHVMRCHLTVPVGSQRTTGMRETVDVEEGSGNS